METFPGVRREMIGKDSSQIVCFPNTWQRRKLVMVARCAAVKVQFPLSQMQKKTMHFLCQLYTVYCQLYTWTNTFAYLDKYISLLRQIHFTIWTNTKFYYIVSRYAPVKVQFPLSLKCTGFLSMSTVFLDRSAHISIIFPSQIGKSCDDKCVISALNFSGSQVFSVFKEWLLFKVYYASIVHLCTLHSLQWHRS